MAIPAAGAPTAHHYVAYGLHVASAIELPELAPAPDAVAATEPDLRVVIGTVPDIEADPLGQRVTWMGAEGQWRHEIAGVARYFVHQGGAEVIIEPTGGSAADLRAFLFGTTIGAVLHQRQMFVLHASAVAGEGGAVAVAGRSGAGKSTTITELARRGHAVLSDDKTVVRFADDGTPRVLSGYPTIRLWEDAVDGFGESTDDLPPLRDDLRKFLYRAPVFRTEPAVLRALVVIAPWDEVSLGAYDPGEFGLETPEGLVAERLEGPKAARVLLGMTYRRRLIDAAGLRGPHFAWATRLANAVPVVRLLRPRNASTVGSVADVIEGRLAAAVAAVP